MTEREADTRCKHGIRNAPYERRTPNPHSQEASSEGESLGSRRASSTNQAVAHFRKNLKEASVKEQASEWAPYSLEGQR